jgi:hypothetical protein
MVVVVLMLAGSVAGCGDKPSSVHSTTTKRHGYPNKVGY